MLKAISPLGSETCGPLMDSRLGDSEGGGSIFHVRPLLEHAAHQHGSTMWHQSCILVNVYSAFWGAGLLPNISNSNQCRMGNLLTDHN